MNLSERLRNAVSYVRARQLSLVDVPKHAALWNDVITAANQIERQQAELDEVRAAFAPVRDWYDTEDGDLELAEMLTKAVADLQEDRAENMRLKAIVVRLPKCWRLVNEDGKQKLVQDCPVVPGMTVFFLRNSKSRIGQIEVDGVEDWGGRGRSVLVRGYRKHGGCRPVERVYSTREAAEFALPIDQKAILEMKENSDEV